jgi:hypothetical protein
MSHQGSEDIHIYTECKKVKVTWQHAYAGTQGRKRYSSNPLAISVQEGGGWSAPCPSHSNMGKNLVPIVQEAGRTLGPSLGRNRIYRPPLGFDPQTVQPETSHILTMLYVRMFLSLRYIYIIKHTYIWSGKAPGTMTWEKCGLLVVTCTVPV